jgi:hypothetical protein
MRKLLGLMGIVVLLGAGVYVGRPAGHIPPYDANLVRLAETELEGYCSGRTFWQTQGYGNAEQAALCREEYAGQYPDTPNLGRVQLAFCLALTHVGYQGGVDTCMAIVRTNQYWPTYDGRISAAWNRARPYPLREGLTGEQEETDGSRTGEREGATRGPVVRSTATASPSPSPEASPSSSSSPEAE